MSAKQSKNGKMAALSKSKSSEGSSKDKNNSNTVLNKDLPTHPDLRKTSVTRLIRVKKAAKRFPSPSQLIEKIIKSNIIHESLYAHLTFDDDFEEEYGKPFDSYYDFCGLMGVSIRIYLPKFKGYGKFVKNATFIRFCHALDKNSERYNPSQPLYPGRLQMEAAYTQVIFQLFDAMTTEDVIALIGTTEEWVKTEMQARTWMKQELARALRGRYRPEVEQYWQEKAKRLGMKELDIAKVDGSFEPEDTGDASLDSDGDVPMTAPPGATTTSSLTDEQRNIIRALNAIKQKNGKLEF